MSRIQGVETRRKPAGKELEEYLKHLRWLSESSFEGIGLSEGGKLVMVNLRLAQMLGYEPEEMIGLAITDFAAPESLGTVIEHIHSGAGESYEHLARRKDGSIFPVEAQEKPLPCRGKTIRVTAIRDITQKKRVESALYESLEWFRQIFEQNEDAILLLEAQTLEILDANISALLLYGRPKEELLGSMPDLLMEPADAAELRAALGTQSTDEVLSLPRLKQRRRDGSSILVSFRGQRVQVKRGDILLCSFRDITEKVRLEEDRRLMQARLIQANKMSTLGLMVSGVVHEINNPNAVVMFNAPLVSEFWKDALEVLDDHYRDHPDFQLGGLPYSMMKDALPKLLAGITEGSLMIDAIVEKLRDFVRQSHTGMDSGVDLNAVASRAVALIESKIRKLSRGVEINLAMNLPAVWGNSQQLTQVVVNLVMNALESLPDASRGLCLSTNFIDGRDDTVGLTVRDEGIGMTSEVMEKVFEPFFTTRLESGGTGLGLFISHSIVKEHGGAIRFQSEPGRGTSVTVSLPAAAPRRCRPHHQRSGR